MISFNDWLHYNDGERLEGLREEYAEVRRDSGDDCPEFMAWAEHKYHVQRLRSWNEEHPISLPPLVPSGLKITLTDQFRNPLHAFRMAQAEVERAVERSKTCTDQGIQNARLQAEITADLEEAVRRREQAAVFLAIHFDALAAAAEAQQA
ncbi:hypothetical protein [Pseudomonas mosselii]|uniref:hypothetical protein n=1 Tax=Pseudomonas mosselii TaxID=78327 RepID=UPI0021D989DB|nr:hypothetical protein [Pseudomonas mosselii]MCU9528064.1 hypothetical protein [Pseudomonas mosselii]MCU9535173.1 hypothetical protein [Pseudomonas mosselii]MCU9542692.1 hypothetical protein [Pseudomonas mosselii]MCU9546908.1 hypothetical protein [Pseudomonas mosselii]